MMRDRLGNCMWCGSSRCHADECRAQKMREDLATLRQRCEMLQGDVALWQRLRDEEKTRAIKAEAERDALRVENRRLRRQSEFDKAEIDQLKEALQLIADEDTATTPQSDKEGEG